MLLDEARHAVAVCSRRTVNLTEYLEAPVVQQLGRDWELAGGYEAFARAITALVTKGVLRPVKAAGENGRMPSLALLPQITRRLMAFYLRMPTAGSVPVFLLLRRP